MATEEHTIEQRLSELLEVERFEPPEAFAASALVSDDRSTRRRPRTRSAWWAEQARSLDWFEPSRRRSTTPNPPFYKWFAGGRLNASHNCLDRHVEAGNGDRVAFHWRGEEGEERTVTYADLHRDVQRFANALSDRGVQKGDIVGIYLPMIPEVVVAMLACARIGAPHNVVFGGFSAESVRRAHGVLARPSSWSPSTAPGARARPRRSRRPSTGACRTCRASSCATPAVEAPMAEKDAYYDELLEAADAECPAEPMDAEDPLFVLYTRGSTAKPKGILHTTGGYLTQVGWTHRYVFDLKPESDVYWCAPTWAGSPATPTSSTGRCSTAPPRSCGRALPTTRTRGSGGSCASATA